MRKREFLYRLDNALESFPNAEREEIIHYYEELIQDALDNAKMKKLLLKNWVRLTRLCGLSRKTAIS